MRSERAILSPFWWELVLIGTVAAVVLGSLLVFYDDSHRATPNGLWKSVDMARWVSGSPDRKPDAANLLYFPVVGVMIDALPESLFGAVFQRMAWTNVGFAAGVLVLTYVIALRLFGARGPAFFASGTHGSMGFFLLLATINEDIMPGYFWFMAAAACVVVPQRLTALVVVLAAQCLALAWLFHSTLEFPGVGAVVVAIVLRTGDLKRAVPRVVLFLAALVPLPVLGALWYGLPWASGFWSGKGIGSGWGGFVWNKVVFMWGGIAQSVSGGLFVSSLEWLLSAGALKTTVTSLCLVALFGVWLWTGWRKRMLEEWRAAAALFSAVFILAEGMNLYIQPHDPQMQIQPMSWFPFAAAAMYWYGMRLQRPAGILVPAGLCACVLALAITNVRAYLPSRGNDTKALRNILTIERLAPPGRTVFLIQGWEVLAPWLTAAWGPGATDAPVSVEQRDQQRFNVIYMTNQAVHAPGRSPNDSAREVVRLVEHALDEGFEVVATGIWTVPEAGWVDLFAPISGPEKPRAMRAALLERYKGTVIGEVPGWTTFYRITRKRTVAPAS